MVLIVDSHQHFWRLARGDYGWNTPDLGAIHRDFTPSDLMPLISKAGVDRTVLVQAAPTLAETQYMLGLADATEAVAAVVGWINFEDQADRRALERLAGHPKFRGVRPLIQDIPDVDWMMRSDIAWAFDALVDLDLTFDALGFPVHLANFDRLIGRYPRLRVVVDHCMKPRIRDRAFDEWAEGLKRLAGHGNVWCKLSGLVTEAGPAWTVEDLRPYVDLVLASFGPDRVMWGSDWPVLNLASTYEHWLAVARELVPDTAADRVFSQSAAKFYRICPSASDAGR
jgi:L-fuconolactonase